MIPGLVNTTGVRASCRTLCQWGLVGLPSSTCYCILRLFSVPRRTQEREHQQVWLRIRSRIETMRTRTSIPLFIVCYTAENVSGIRISPWVHKWDRERRRKYCGQTRGQTSTINCNLSHQTLEDSCFWFFSPLPLRIFVKKSRITRHVWKIREKCWQKNGEVGELVIKARVRSWAEQPSRYVI